MTDLAQLIGRCITASASERTTDAEFKGALEDLSAAFQSRALQAQKETSEDE